MFITTLFTKAKRWKQPKCSSTEEWINKMWYIHIMEYYLVIERNEVLMHAATWMNLENMLSEGPDIKGQILYGSTYTKYLE